MSNRAEILQRLHDVGHVLQGFGFNQPFMVVGGSAPATFVLDRKGVDVRATKDVDLVVPGDQRVLDELLRKLGRYDIQPGLGDHIGRVRIDGLAVDFIPEIPHAADVNRSWFNRALETCRSVNGLPFSVIDPVAFIATKQVALNAPDRGRTRDENSWGYAFGSSDLEDLITVLEGSLSVRSAIESGSEPMVRFIRFELAKHLSTADGLELIQSEMPGDPVGQSRAVSLWNWLTELPRI